MKLDGFRLIAITMITFYTINTFTYFLFLMIGIKLFYYIFILLIFILLFYDIRSVANEKLGVDTFVTRASINAYFAFHYLLLITDIKQDINIPDLGFYYVYTMFT